MKDLKIHLIFLVVIAILSIVFAALMILVLPEILMGVIK